MIRKPRKIIMECDPDQDLMQIAIGKDKVRVLPLSSPMTENAIVGGARLLRDEAVTELISTNRYNFEQNDLLRRGIAARRELVRDFHDLYEVALRGASARMVTKYVREFVEFYAAI